MTKFRDNMPSQEDLETIYHQTVSIIKTAVHFGTSAHIVKQWLRYYGIRKYTQVEANKHDTQLRYKSVSIPKKDISLSTGKDDIRIFIESLGLTHADHPDFDIFISEKNLGIIYAPIIQNSETFGHYSRRAHYDKYRLAETLGIKLLVIFESEWTLKTDIVKSIILHKLGLVQEKIPARKTICRLLCYADIRQFEEDNHLQGSRPAGIYYGLFRGDDLVMTLSLGKSRFSKKYEYEIVRMTTKKNVAVIGGMSKIFSNVTVKSCVTYADNRYGDGHGYTNIGFRKVSVSSPNYFYFHESNPLVLHSRVKFQKHRIPNVDPAKSEYANMVAKGYGRIWDCGNAVYELVR